VCEVELVNKWISSRRGNGINTLTEWAVSESKWEKELGKTKLRRKNVVKQ
jgi:hypothetical protein